jgi:hypothetical protein
MQMLDIVYTCVLGILGYFLRDVHASTKESKIKHEEQYFKMSEELGKLKGKIEIVESKTANDLIRIEQVTQLQLQQITKELAELTRLIQQVLDKK